MNIIYLHGFQSDSLASKGQSLKQYCESHSAWQVHVPDLNMPPHLALEKIEALAQSLDQVVLVGSSLGGFYATQLVAKLGVPAVLLNPAMQPWRLFRDLFGSEQLPFKVNEHWTLDDAQLDYMEQIELPFVQDADKILVLLQQGDEVLDYREAQRYYNGAALVISETQGNHVMDDFADKIPMALQFLSDCLK